jgi:hypothetical protein
VLVVDGSVDVWRTGGGWFREILGVTAFQFLTVGHFFVCVGSRVGWLVGWKIFFIVFSAFHQELPVKL